MLGWPCITLATLGCSAFRMSGTPACIQHGAPPPITCVCRERAATRLPAWELEADLAYRVKRAETAAGPGRQSSRPRPGVLGGQGDEPAASLPHTCLQVKMNLRPAGGRARELLSLQSLGHPSKARDYLQLKPALQRPESTQVTFR